MAFVFRIGDDAEQVLDAFASDGRNNPELRKVPADCMITAVCWRMNRWRAVQRQAALLLRCLGRNEPHVGPGDRFADGLGVSGIVLMSLDIRLHMGCRHQTHCVSKRLEFA
jgi:hypothetical protein